MKRLIFPIILLISIGCNAWATPASDAYRKAQTCYEELKKNEKLSLDSKNWVHCISDFKKVAESYPNDPKAPEALYSAARLSRELYKQSGSAGYIEESIHLYNTVVKDYPDHALADDALYQIGMLRHDPMKEDDKAKRAWNALLSRYPNGDMAPKAKEALESLGTGSAITESAVAEKDAKKQPVPAEAKEKAPPPAEAKEKAPAAEESGDRFRISKLKRMSITPGQAQTLVTIELDRLTPFTLKFIEYGARTKTPARLTLQFPRTKLDETVPKEESVSSPHVTAIKIKEGVFTGEVAIRFDLRANTTYEVSQKNERTIIRFFIQGSKPQPVPKEEKPLKKGPLSGTASNSLRIVIDPGHGGKDTGAIGPNGVEEKTVTLAIAKKLARTLEKEQGAIVYLTRSRDVDLPLEKRNEFANAKKADLFISIHANANKNKSVSGVETYYLNNASDEAAKRLAQRENRSAAKPQSQVDKILLTLSQNYTTEESRVFAGDVHKTVIEDLSGRYKGLKDHKVRSALFYVLVGAKCPGILVETSFISNPTEEKRLTNPAYQSAIADAIASGIEQYVRTGKDRVATL